MVLLSTTKWYVLNGKDHYFSGDLFHQQFQGGLIICWLVFDFQGKNHGISKLVVWRSQNPAIESQTLLSEGPMILVFSPNYN